MKESELIEAYHQLANEAMGVQRRIELRNQHWEVFDLLSRTDFKRSVDRCECEECQK